MLDGLIDAGGNPLMAWCISNVVVQRDGKDNIYPVKKKSRGRIDPVIAALMARKLATLDKPAASGLFSAWWSDDGRGAARETAKGGRPRVPDPGVPVSTWLPSSRLRQDHQSREKRRDVTISALVRLWLQHKIWNSFP